MREAEEVVLIQRGWVKEMCQIIHPGKGGCKAARKQSSLSNENLERDGLAYRLSLSINLAALSDFSVMVTPLRRYERNRLFQILPSDRTQQDAYLFWSVMKERTVQEIINIDRVHLRI
jgi:hypothetical protein